jgi:hypothetical protein
MIVKIAKAIWFTSMLAAVAGLLYAYASFPEMIQVNESPDGATQTVPRSQLFYAVLGLLGLFNAMVFVVNRLMAKGDTFFQAWFYGLIVFFNLFILVSLQFFNLYNSQEKFDYGRIGFIIYGSVGLVILWASLWPLTTIIRMFYPKHPVGNE